MTNDENKNGNVPEETNNDNDFQEYKPDQEKFDQEQESLEKSHEPSEVDLSATESEPPLEEEETATTEDASSEEESVNDDTNSEEPIIEVVSESTHVKVELTEDPDTNLYSALAHGSNILFFTLVWAPVLLFFLKNENQKIKFHAKQSAIYGLIVAVVTILPSLLTAIFPPLCCCLGPVALLLGLGMWGYAIYITYIVYNGEDYRIPVIADFADKIDI